MSQWKSSIDEFFEAKADGNQTLQYDDETSAIGSQT
jgi:hypothetical protein